MATPRPGGTGVLQGVGEGLLHDPVCGEVEACRELVRLLHHVHLHRRARVGELLGKPIDLPQAWLRTVRHCLGFRRTENPQHALHV